MSQRSALPWRACNVVNEKQNSLLAPPPLNLFEASVDDAMQLLDSLRPLESSLREAAACCISSFKGGHKLLACGNGGSACEAQHLVGELIGRYRGTRDGLPAVALTADSAVLTCVGNDFRFEDVFARQVQALGNPGDVLVAFTTSGYSGNVLAALELARKLQLTSIAFLGRDGGAAACLADCKLIVPHTDTARIQEGHQFLMHSLMDIIEAETAHES